MVQPIENWRPGLAGAGGLAFSAVGLSLENPGAAATWVTPWPKRSDVPNWTMVGKRAAAANGTAVLQGGFIDACLVSLVLRTKITITKFMETPMFRPEHPSH